MWFRMRRRLTRDALVLLAAAFALAGVGAIVVGAVELLLGWAVGVPLMVLVALVAALTLGSRR